MNEGRAVKRVTIGKGLLQGGRVSSGRFSIKSWTSRSSTGDC